MTAKATASGPLSAAIRRIWAAVSSSASSQVMRRQPGSGSPFGRVRRIGIQQPVGCLDEFGRGAALGAKRLRRSGATDPARSQPVGRCRRPPRSRSAKHRAGRMPECGAGNFRACANLLSIVEQAPTLGAHVAAVNLRGGTARPQVLGGDPIRPTSAFPFWIRATVRRPWTAAAEVGSEAAATYHSVDYPASRARPTLHMGC